MFAPESPASKAKYLVEGIVIGTFLLTVIGSLKVIPLLLISLERLVLKVNDKGCSDKQNKCCTEA